MHYEHFFVSNMIYTLVFMQKRFTRFFCHKNDSRISSGKFSRVEICHPESLYFLGLCRWLPFHDHRWRITSTPANQIYDVQLRDFVFDEIVQWDWLPHSHNGDQYDQWWLLVKSIQGRSLRGQDWCHGTDTANWPTRSRYLEPLYLYWFCWAGVWHEWLIQWISPKNKAEKIAWIFRSCWLAPSLYCIIAFWNMDQSGELQIYQTGFLIEAVLVSFT